MSRISTHIVAAVAGAALAAGAATAHAAWTEPAGPVSPVPGAATLTPDIAEIGGVPWVAWVDDRSGGDWIRVAKLTETGWRQVGANPSPFCRLIECAPVNRNGGTDARTPRLTDLGSGTPGLSWTEFDITGAGGDNWELQDARLNASGVWVTADQQAAPLNVSSVEDADFPSWFRAGGLPHLLWREAVANTGNTQRRLHVVRLVDDKFWELVSDASLATALGGEKQPGNPQAATVGGVPHASWYTPNSLPGTVGIVVARTGANGWERLPPLTGGARDRYGLADVGGQPAIAYVDTTGNGSSLRVVRYSGVAATGWDQLGTGLPLNGATVEGSPALRVIGGVPWVVWIEGADGTLRAARLGPGGAWERVGDAPGGIRPGSAAVALSAAGVGPMPYVAWAADVNPDEIHAARLEPEVIGTAIAPGPVTARVTASVQTFGLPVSAGVEHGTGGALAGGPLGPLGGGVAPFARDLTGLAPATDYAVRVVLAVGPITLRGPLTPFRTLPLPPGGPGGPPASSGTTGRILPALSCRRLKRAIRCRVALTTRLARGTRVRVALVRSGTVLAGSGILTVGRRGRLVVVLLPARTPTAGSARLRVRRVGARRAAATFAIRVA